jgi:hypothetical protein
MTTIKTWQDSYLKLVGRAEEPVVEFTARASKAIADYVPERPDWAFLDAAPTITELVDNQLKFRRRVVDEQAAFVHKLMKAMRRALTRLETTSAPMAAPTVKPSAQRHNAQRSTARRVPVHRGAHVA